MRIHRDTEAEQIQEVDAIRDLERRQARGGRTDDATARAAQMSPDVTGRAYRWHMTGYDASFIQFAIASYGLSIYGEEYVAPDEGE